MLHILTSLFLEHLNQSLALDLSATTRVECRDFNRWDGDSDVQIRTEKNYICTDKVVLSADGSIAFSVARGKPSGGRLIGCGCRWTSAHSAFQFHYDLFCVQTPICRRYFVYLEAAVFLQKCRKHKAQATDFSLEGSFVSSGASDKLQCESVKLCSDFISHLTVKVNSLKTTTMPSHPSERKVKFSLEDQEEVKEPTQLNPEPEVDRMSEEYLTKIFEDYERTFKAKAQSAAAKREKFEAYASSGPRTKGKHVSSLCQACHLGVCTYIMRAKPPQGFNPN
jgi:hypothetical protein